jgi:hypothetical protein
VQTRLLLFLLRDLGGRHFGGSFRSGFLGLFPAVLGDHDGDVVLLAQLQFRQLDALRQLQFRQVDDATDLQVGRVDFDEPRQVLR